MVYKFRTKPWSQKNPALLLENTLLNWAALMSASELVQEVCVLSQF